MTANDWDLNDVVNSISIEADGEEYIVENDNLMIELSDFLDEEIEVIGIVTENGDGTKYIRIVSYELLEGHYDYDEFTD